MNLTLRDDKLVNEAAADEDSADRLAIETLTPELALVDPELARLGRARLPDPGQYLLFRIDQGDPRGAADSRLTPPGGEASTEVIRNATGGGSAFEQVEDAGAPTPTLAERTRFDPAPATRDGEPRQRPSAQHRWHKTGFLAALLIFAMTGLFALTWTRTGHDMSPRGLRREAGNPAKARTKTPAQTRRQAKRTPTVAPKASSHSRVPSRTAQKPRTARAASKASPQSTIAGGLSKKRGNSSPPSAFGTRVFIWPANEHARLYKVAFFRHGKEVFEAFRAQPRLELPLRWTYRHRDFRLTPGPYNWTVWPAYGPRAKLRYGRPIVQSIWVTRQ